jgi:GNAT superfamily N-acetyltransferase
MATSQRDRQVRVLPATEDRWDDVVACFGRRGNDPQWCWCQRLVGTTSDGDNRAALHRQITVATVPFGLVAFVDEQPVGWSRISPRSDLPGVLSHRALKRILPEDSGAWWATCFVVNATHRGYGIGHALLNAAVSHARDHGATAVEGHPVDVDKLAASRVSGSALFTGTLTMFTAAGFAEIGRTFPSRPVMRLQL